MRNYAIDNDINIIKHLKYDVVIIGSGVAGLYSAINLNDDIKCLVINKNGIEESNSIYAQGGIASVYLEADSFESHYNDTLSAGAGLCNKEAVKVLITEGPEDIKKLFELGVPFDRDENNNVSITREGAHSISRILHCGGDATGLLLTQTLIKNAKSKTNINFLNYTTLCDILTDNNGKVSGLIAIQNEENILIETSQIILASGGIGQLYRNSTNSKCATGDGIACALRANVKVNNMEFVQFHPTALIHPDLNMKFFLISEALRGEGALLLNRKGERFMKKAHPLAELAPRDIVTRSIIHEMKKNDAPNVYLDITFKSRDYLKKRFPKIYDGCMKRGIDIAVNWIPVIPVQHYFMGGIETDLNGKTNVDGLYACGECACTGLHGANRLASNSLLECLVYGRRCAQSINNKKFNNNKTFVMPVLQHKNDNVFDYETYRSVLRDLMTKKSGILRNETDMSKAYKEIKVFYDNLIKSKLKTLNELEVLNMVTVSLEILKAAIKRKDSVGAHYREG
jgi:L-aspartate oxidase